MIKLRKILLIDDDRTQQRLMQEMVKNFRSGPFGTRRGGDVRDGLKKLLSGKYAVCLLDYAWMTATAWRSCARPGLRAGSRR